MEKIVLPQARDLGQTIGDAFLFVRANFKFLIRYFLFYAVPPLLIAVTFFAFGYKKGDSGVSQYTPTYNLFSHLDGLGMLGYLLYLGALFFQHIYITELLILKGTQEEVTNAQVLAQLKEDTGTIVSTFFFTIALIFPVGAVAGIIFYLANDIGGYLPAIVGIIFVVLFIYAIVPLYNLLFVRLREKLSMTDALVKCFKITNGNWWRTFVAWFVIAIIFYAFIVSLMTPFILLMVLLRYHTPMQSDILSMAVLGITGTLAVFMYFFSLNIFQVFIGVNYFSLSEKYDSYHLIAEINQIGVRDDRSVHRQEGEY